MTPGGTDGVAAAAVALDLDEARCSSLSALDRDPDLSSPEVDRSEQTLLLLLLRLSTPESTLLWSTSLRGSEEAVEDGAGGANLLLRSNTLLSFFRSWLSVFLASLLLFLFKSSDKLLCCFFSRSCRCLCSCSNLAFFSDEGRGNRAFLSACVEDELDDDAADDAAAP